MRQLLVLFVMMLFGGASAPALAQSWQPPTDAQRCPSRWGAGDQTRRRQSHEAGDGPAAALADTHRPGLRARTVCCRLSMPFAAHAPVRGA